MPSKGWCSYFNQRVMSENQSEESSANEFGDNGKPESSSPQPSQSQVPPRPLRAWPAIVLLVLSAFLASLTRLSDEQSDGLLMSGLMGPLVCGGLILIWWLAASRATWKERLLGAVSVIVGLVVVVALSDATMRGPVTMLMTIPMGLAGFGLGAVIARKNPVFRRTHIAVGVAVFGMLPTLFFRSEGMDGTTYSFGFQPRWSPTAEERFLAEHKDFGGSAEVQMTEDAVASALANPEWPEFRGAGRAGVVRGVKLATNWDARAPEKLWSVTAGPGWSSFSVAGELLFTQEQRGPLETVVCYDATSGKEIWSRAVESRFEEPLGGPGPRATPTLAHGALFAQGAQGWLLRLDPLTGEIAWKVDLRKVAGREPPMWGFASSPLVLEFSVVVHAGAAGELGLLAFDIEKGELVESAPSGDHSYGSPQLAELAGRKIVLMVTNIGLDAYDASTGEVLLRYESKVSDYRVAQPILVEGDSVILAASSGTKRLRLTEAGDKLTAEEVWNSRFLKPDFNDFVIHQGHAYGFDGSIFTSIDLSDGRRNWKDGRYGKGQVLLIEDAELLLVTGEYGEVLLLAADPTEHRELASFQALEGKTWNHPVVVGDRLFVRNGQEIACYRLPLAGVTP